MRAEEGDVGDADDGIVLTDREREALAGLAESIGDPWLAGQLAGPARARMPSKVRIEPPPAATVSTSSMGERIFAPATLAVSRRSSAPA